MKTINTSNIAITAVTVLSLGVISGCEYCQPLLLATVSTMIITAAINWLKTNAPEDMVEIFSHIAH